jgi:succinoglycan biosynthesis transport protein ExoP
VIVVTGARPEDGKSTVSAHLAAVLAAGGNSVIAVEADLHRPALHRLLGVAPGSPGVRDVVAGALPLEGVLVEIDSENVLAPVHNTADREIVASRVAGNGSAPAGGDRQGSEGRLRLLPAGTGADSPMNVLALGSSSPLISRLRALCDYVVVDTPPLLLSGDAYPLLQLADAVLVVCRERATVQEEARRTRKILRSLGVRDFSLVVSESASAARSDYYGYAMSE